MAGAAGLGIALPSLDYLAALAVIAAGADTAATRLSALVMFNVVAFTLVEIPLLAYLVVPTRTHAAMTQLHHWIRGRRRRRGRGTAGGRRDRATQRRPAGSLRRSHAQRGL